MKNKKLDKQEKLVNHLKKFLGIKFKIKLIGYMDIDINEVESNDDKYVEINDAKGETYMDWCYDEFTKKELKKYAKSITKEQGNDSDKLAKEYLQLGERILKALKYKIE